MKALSRSSNARSLTAAPREQTFGFRALQIGQFAGRELRSLCPVAQRLPLPAGQPKVFEIETYGQQEAVILRKESESFLDTAVECLVDRQRLRAQCRAASDQNIQNFCVFLEPVHIIRAPSVTGKTFQEKRLALRQVRSARSANGDDVGHGGFIPCSSFLKEEADHAAYPVGAVWLLAYLS